MLWLKIERGALAGKVPELTPKDLGLETDTKTPHSKSEAAGTKFHPIPPKGIDFRSLQHSFGRFYIEEAFQMGDGNERSGKLSPDRATRCS